MYTITRVWSRGIHVTLFPWILFIGIHQVREMATETKYAPSDWHTSNSVIRSTAERQRSTTHDVRNLSYRARNETGMMQIAGNLI